MASSGAQISKPKWDETIDEFRALGGVADNIEHGVGALGRGLLLSDPSTPAQIAVPENLLIDVDDVVFQKGQFRIKKDANVPDRERAFFESFENELSWGDGGHSECESYLESVDKLPIAIREALSRDVGLTLPWSTGMSDERIQRRFIRSRSITYEGRRKLMPVLELVNHGVEGCKFKFEKGISIAGSFESEMLAHYGLYDPYGVLDNWGFSSAEPVAFSIPAVLTVDSHRLVISRKLTNSAVRGPFRVPTVERDGNTFRISFMMLGHADYPRLSKGIFYQLMEDIGQQNAEALFDEVRRFNIQKFLSVLELLDEHQGPLIVTLRQMCRQQIAAITHSIGTRKIDG
ncbi:MAG: hypothetical protein AAGF48_12405 [Pseudomonadota bacterium]